MAWSGKPLEAQALYEAVLASEPAHPEALLGLIRLLGYRGQASEAAALAARARQLLPGDAAIRSEARRAQSRLRRESPYRHSLRAGFLREEFSFAVPGNNLSLSWQNRSFFGWSAGAAAGFDSRFGSRDLDLGVNASRRLAGTAARAGFALGGAVAHDILAAFRASVSAGAPLGEGFALDGELGFRRFDDAGIASISPRLSWRGEPWSLALGYTLSRTRFDSGKKGGDLSSYRTRLAWLGSPLVEPWLSYSRSMESFEAPASRRLSNFSSNRYGTGFRLDLDPWELQLFYEREERPGRDGEVDRFGLATGYAWGR